MRSSTAWKANLIKRLDGDAKNASVLLDVELALTLVTTVCPEETPKRPSGSALRQSNTGT